MSCIIAATFNEMLNSIICKRHSLQKLHVKSRAQPLGGRGGPDPSKFGRTTPTFYVAADCSARNWVYYPYFVPYNNLDQGIGPPTLKTWLRPCVKLYPTAAFEARRAFHTAMWWEGFVKYVSFVPRAKDESGVDSPLSSSKTSSFFHSRFKTYLFHKSRTQTSLLACYRKTLDDIL